MAREHVAIVDVHAARALMRGTKQIETRFYRQRRLPLGCIQRGDTLHFKLSGGRFIGTSTVRRVREFVNLDPPTMTHLRRVYNAAVRASGSYWRARRHARYGVLIWLGPLADSPGQVAIPRQYGGAWVVLGER